MASEPKKPKPREEPPASEPTAANVVDLNAWRYRRKRRDEELAPDAGEGEV